MSDSQSRAPAGPPGGGASRREHERVPVDVAAEVTFSRDDRVPARTHDLSLGGVRLVMGREVKEEQTLSLSLHLTEDGIEDPDVPPILLRAVAVWSAESDDGQWTVGCRFVGVKPAEQAQIEVYLRAAGGGTPH